MKDVLKRILIGAACASIGVGAVGALVAWAIGHAVSSTMAAAYYIVGAILFLIGMAPSGGFSLMRGSMTRRRPTGSRQEPIFLLGLVLIGLGVVADVVHPF